MNLIREFSSEQYADALKAWDWTGIGDKVPLFASPFGDVFLGQIHGQIKDLPEGAEISISTDSEGPGWAAIEAALRELYGDAGPAGTVAPNVAYSAGGPDPHLRMRRAASALAPGELWDVRALREGER